MSKAIKWHIPFASLSGTLYRIDIYAEGYSGDPIQLTAGESPFVTEEDSSEDFFAPIRTQTGTLTVCTHDEDGNVLITLDDILPANNISRPVRLVNVGTGAIEWQGFLSCEAYDQDYTSIPQNLQLPVIGVLEAMASVQLDPTRTSGLQPIYVCLPDILQEIDRQSGITCFTHLNYSRTDYRIISKYIDMTVMFEQKEYNNENSTTYIVSGLSAKDALERLCTYMGWIAREKGTEIYLQRIGEEIGMFREEIDEFPGVAQQQSITETGIAATFADKWRGTDHKRTVSQGAKSVEVVAKIITSDFSLKLPDFPYIDVTDLQGRLVARYNDWTYAMLYIMFEKNGDAYSNIEHIYQAGSKIQDSPLRYNYYGTTTEENALKQMYLRQVTEGYIYTGAFFVRYEFSEQATSTHSLKDALYCGLIPGIGSTYAPIMKMWTPRIYSFNNGKLNIKADMLFYGLIRTSSSTQTPTWTDKMNASYFGMNESMYFVLRIGDKYWNGSSWGSVRAVFGIPLYNSETEKSGIDLDIPIDQYMPGDVQIEVMAGVSTNSSTNFLSEVLFNSLEISFKSNPNYKLTDRGENHYFRLLGTNFRDEISIGTELASTLNNQPSPSLIMNSDTEAMTELNYGTDQVPDMRRPEVDLLNRLAEYYQAARHRLSLIVEHPTAAPFPLLRLNGISPDNRKYLPLSESRDWCEETCTIKCFETI